MRIESRKPEGKPLPRNPNALEPRQEPAQVAHDLGAASRELGVAGKGEITPLTSASELLSPLAGRGWVRGRVFGRQRRLNGRAIGNHRPALTKSLPRIWPLIPPSPRKRGEGVPLARTGVSRFFSSQIVFVKIFMSKVSDRGEG